MYRRSRFLVGLAAAAITFGSLWFALPGHFNRGHRMCHPMEHHCVMQQEREDDGCCGQMQEHHGNKTVIIKEIIRTDSIKK